MDESFCQEGSSSLGDGLGLHLNEFSSGGCSFLVLPWWQSTERQEGGTSGSGSRDQLGWWESVGKRDQGSPARASWDMSACAQTRQSHQTVCRKLCLMTMSCNNGEAPMLFLIILFLREQSFHRPNLGEGTFLFASQRTIIKIKCKRNYVKMCCKP